MKSLLTPLALSVALVACSATVALVACGATEDSSPGGETSSTSPPSGLTDATVDTSPEDTEDTAPANTDSALAPDGTESPAEVRTPTDTADPPETTDACEDVLCEGATPFCVEGVCVACLTSNDPVPDGLCQGVCALVPPTCNNYAWQCSGPGYELQELSCDGFDNDCDGTVDEGVCPTCDLDMEAIQSQLGFMADIDFDFACRTYLTTAISGPDYVTIIDPVEPVQKFYGNANQNMYFALVDPDPSAHRVVVTYSCCPACGCQASNGVTLLHTCDPAEPDCACAEQNNCPGFLNVPFLPAGQEDTSVTWSGYPISTPTGLAVGPGNTYYVGNFAPKQCSSAADCTPCDPDHPEVWCSADALPCCVDSPLGRLARFTLPTALEPATWRHVLALEGEHIIGLASGRDGSVMVGTKTTEGGHLYRHDPYNETASLLHAFEGAVFSITQDRRNGDWYLEILEGSPKIRRLWDAGTLRPLPPDVAPDPPLEGVLQAGPDGRLYRLVWDVGGSSTLTRATLPLWAKAGQLCNEQVLCEAPMVCSDSLCVSP